MKREVEIPVQNHLPWISFLIIFFFFGGQGVGGGLESWAEEGSLHVQMSVLFGGIHFESLENI